MIGYLVRRIAQAVVVILLVTVLVFLLVRALPGDPVEILVTQSLAQTETLEQIESLRHELGLDRNVAVQYFDWLGHAIQGDLGKSVLNRYDVSAEIGRRLLITLELGLISFVIGLVVGPLLGIVSALRRGKWLDSVVTMIANLGITAPPFWIGIIFMYVLGLWLKILPVYGYTSPLEDLAKNLQQSVMPVLVLAMFPVASAARQTRASVIEVMRQDYIRTAWAKGLSERVIVVRHVLKNALMPVVTLQGILLRNIIGGSVIVETVFVVPGMGKLLVDAIQSQDYTVIQGVILVVAIAVVIANLIVDILYGWLDPRIQYE
jgi:peptide/nickel transport system permease protein